MTRTTITRNWRGKCAPVADVIFDDAPDVVVIKVAPVVRVVVVAPWTAPDALDTCLDCWSTWMGRNDTDLGAQAQRTMKGDGDGLGNSETMAARRDNEIAEATDAMISGLASSHRWAIYRKCGLSTGWRFPQLNFVVHAEEACSELEKKLRTNIATRMLFG
jgi:hypothetical protein